MPNWAIHLIVPLLILLIAARKEHYKLVLLLLPLAVISDFDTFVTQHRALLHNIFIPLFLFLSGLMVKEKRTILMISGVYFASHVVMDMFDGGVVLFYPFYNRMAFVDASLQMDQGYRLIWTLDYGFKDYAAGWLQASGYITDSVGTGALGLIMLAVVWAAYRNRKWLE